MKSFMNMNWYKHLKTINHHKWLVMKNCFRVGLYKQGLLPWSLFPNTLGRSSPVGVKYYGGEFEAPNDAERRKRLYKCLAPVRHKGRNKHHLEYWVDYGAD